MEALEEAVEAIIAELIREGVTDDEVARAKRRMQSRAIYARDSAVGGARTLGAALASGQAIADVESWPERIGAVTRKQIFAAARAIFQDKSSVTGMLLPVAAKERK